MTKEQVKETKFYKMVAERIKQYNNELKNKGGEK